MVEPLSPAVVLRLNQLGGGMPRGDDPFRDSDQAFPLGDVLQGLIESTLDFKQSVRVATTVAIVLSGIQVVDAIALAVDDRVLVKNQGGGPSDPTNGWYNVQLDAWTRTDDANTSAEVTAGAITPVDEGAVNVAFLFILTTPNPITLDVTPLAFSPISGAIGLAILPPADVTKSAAVVGVSGRAAREDHKHDISTAAPSIGIGSGNTEGVATSLARSDHNHTIRETGGPTDLTMGAVADGEGFLRSGANIVGFSPVVLTAVAPVNVTKAAAVVGVGTTSARHDHKHDIDTAAPGVIQPDNAAAEGVATSLARSDHTHGIVAAAPSIGIGAANTEGVSTSFSRADHNHVLRESGGTDLSIGAIGANQLFQRVGATVVGIDYSLQNAYTVGASGIILLTTPIGPFAVDGAALAAGAAGTSGPDYFQVRRGGINVLNTAFNATDNIALIYSAAINGMDIGPDPAIIPDRAIISLGVPDRLTFLRQDRTITTGSPGFFRWVSALTLDAAIPLLARSFGGFIDLGGTFQFNASASPFGMGNALLHRATWKNANAVVANLGPSFLFANNAVYQADGATITASQARIFFDNASYNVINAGVGSMGSAVGHVSFYSNLIINPGWTLQLRRGLLLQDATVTGSLVDQIVVDIVDLNAGSGLNIGIRSALLSGVGKFFLQHTGTARSDFGGVLGLGAGATVDWEISRVAANLASLADGDSLRITTGSLFFGVAGSVSLLEGAANRLDLASGDDFRLLSGALQFAGVAEQISASAGELLLTGAIIRTTAALEVDGALDHDGATIGFYGTAPAVQSAAYTRNAVIVEDRTLLASASATVLNNNNVLAALIADLQAIGVLG